MLIIQCGHQRSGGVLQYNLIKTMFLVKQIEYVNEGWCTWQRFGQVIDKYIETERPITILKTHPYLPDRHPLLLDEQFKALYTYRDPRDAIISQMRLSKLSFEEILTVAYSWRKQYNKWIRLPSSNILISRYEDFINNTSLLVSAMANFLGVACTENEINHIANVNSLQRMKNKIAQQDDEFDKQTVLHKKHITNNGKVGGYLDVLTQGQQDIVWNKLGTWMKKMGYEKEVIEEKLNDTN